MESDPNGFSRPPLPVAQPVTYPSSPFTSTHHSSPPTSGRSVAVDERCEGPDNLQSTPSDSSSADWNDTNDGATSNDNDEAAKRQFSPASADIFDTIMSVECHSTELKRLVATLASRGAISEENAKYFFTAVKLSPITKDSLSELDIRNIVNNTKLRHDINFDRELHFRPNLDGEKGQKKKGIQKEYWSAVEVELCLYNTLYGEFASHYLPTDMDINRLKKEVQQRLPDMFETIKEIVINLVPQRDQEAVEGVLDVSLLMRNIEKQLCDFVSISQSIASLLKHHCAPMRDNLIDGMVEKMREGTVTSIAAGLRDLFSILEAMKLDVANHQIRYLRGLLIDETIKFESSCHQKRIERKPVLRGPPRAWYLGLSRELDDEFQSPLRDERELKPFITGLVRLLLPPYSWGSFPETFSLDAKRLRQLRNELQGIYFLSICSEVFVRLVTERGFESTLPTQAIINLQNDLQDIIRQSSSPDCVANTISISNISIELARHAARYLSPNQELDFELTERADFLLERLRHFPDLINRHSKTMEDDLIGGVLFSIINERYLHLSTWDLSNALVPPTVPPSNLIPIPPTQPQLAAKKADIIRRITHIVVLHWRTWAPLVYLNEKIDITEDGQLLQEYGGGDKDSVNAGLPKDGPSRTPTPANTDPGRLLARLPPSDPAPPDTPSTSGQLTETNIPTMPSSNVQTHEH